MKHEKPPTEIEPYLGHLPDAPMSMPKQHVEGVSLTRMLLMVLALWTGQRSRP